MPLQAHIIDISARQTLAGLVAAEPEKGLEERLGGWAKQIANLFPLWLTIVGALSVVQPASMSWFRSTQITAGLALTMGTMGTTLTVDVGAARTPKCILNAEQRMILLLQCKDCKTKPIQASNELV